MDRFCVFLQKRRGCKWFLAEVTLELLFILVADSVVHQCRFGTKDFVALIANKFFTDLLILLCTSRVSKVVQFQCIVSLKPDPASLTQIFSLVTVHCLHVPIYVLHPLRLIFTELALQVDSVDRLCSF